MQRKFNLFLLFIGYSFGASPVLSCLLGHGVAFIPAVMIWSTVMTIEHVTSMIFPDKGSIFTNHDSMSKFPVIIGVLLIGLSIMTCGALALFIGYVFYFCYICILMKQMKLSTNNTCHGVINVHIALSLLWMCQLLLHLPHLMHWRQEGSNTDPGMDIFRMYTLFI